MQEYTEWNYVVALGHNTLIQMTQNVFVDFLVIIFKKRIIQVKAQS